MPVQDMRIWKKPEDHPILFEECFLKTNYKPPVVEQKDEILEELGMHTLYEDYYRGVHLFVFVHGLQGTN